MPNNYLLDSAMYTRATLAKLGGKLHVVNNMFKGYSDEFGKTGHKIGAKLQIRKPQRFIATSGNAWQPQPLVNTSTEVTINRLTNVHFAWDGIERVLSLDDINDNYADPAATALANDINAQCAEFIALNTFNEVGTPGTTPTSMLTYLAGGDKLIQQGMPENMEDDLRLIINRKMGSAYIDASKTYFNSTAVIGEQQKKGRVVDQLGYRWLRDQTIYSHTSGAYAGTILVNGGAQGSEGGNNATGTLVTDGHTSGTSTIKAGDVFRITGVYSVHPQTRKSTGDLQDFVALTTQTDTTGAMTIVMSPAITASGQYQNVDSQPADNAPLIFSSAASTVSTKGLLFHKKAFAFTSVPLAAPAPNSGASMVSAFDSDTGITLQKITYYDGDTLTQKHRFEVLWDVAPLYREMACRIAG